MRLINLTGRKFGRWTVIERAHTRLGKVRWLCECDCGARYTVSATSLMRGTSKSCGCPRRRQAWNHRHGESGHSFYSAEYNAWMHMRQPARIRTILTMADTVGAASRCVIAGLAASRLSFPTWAGALRAGVVLIASITTATTSQAIVGGPRLCSR